MLETVFKAPGAQLREASGEDFGTIVDSGLLTVQYAVGQAPVIEVDGISVDWLGAYKKVDRKNYMFNTPDLMTFKYVTIPNGLPDEDYEHFEAIIAAIHEGKPTPLKRYPAVPAVPYAVLPLADAASRGALSAPPVSDASAAGGSDAAAGGTADPKTESQKIDKSFMGQMNAIGSVLQCLAQKAMHDTAQVGQAVGQAMKDRAEQDMKELQKRMEKTDVGKEEGKAEEGGLTPQPQ